MASRASSASTTSAISPSPGLLLAPLSAAPAPRVVTMSSGVHRIGTIKFDDLQREHGYNNWLAYGQSKLANLMFCFELQRRATAAGSPLLSYAAHPGYAATNLQFAAPAHAYEKWFMAIGNKLIAQSAEMGALPALYAATIDGLPGGSFVGPDGTSSRAAIRRSSRASAAPTTRPPGCGYGRTPSG